MVLRVSSTTALVFGQKRELQWCSGACSRQGESFCVCWSNGPVWFCLRTRIMGDGHHEPFNVSKYTINSDFSRIFRNWPPMNAVCRRLV
ncbi:hypothetical protein L596_030834 [Steinernema carpocapsae]|uniref:Uncharacterized protein n=1 Tax=Steinernema carpocapsae TaxID=34508 RepID=A0A4U5LN86_STECR|nr:hypothetical protein L596_030834 [Steinernema carpocapsae]